MAGGHVWQWTCMVGGAWQGGAWQEACMVGGMHPGETATQAGWYTCHWNAFLLHYAIAFVF